MLPRTRPAISARRLAPSNLSRVLILSLFTFIASGSPAFAVERNVVELGRFPSGSTFSFVRGADGTWGIEVAGSGGPRFGQAGPARIEVFRPDSDIRELVSGYQTIERTASGVLASAELAMGGGTVFHVRDTWSIDGSVATVHRTVGVTGDATGGFASSVVFDADPKVDWGDVNCFAPGAIYGDPTYDGERSPGGTLNYARRRFVMREDLLPAPVFALSLSDGTSVSILDPAPRGDSTVAETRLADAVVTDARLQFGSLGAWQDAGGPIKFGFTFPGTMSVYPFRPDVPAEPNWFRRYHPIKAGVGHSYQTSFRFAAGESFPDATREAWRWAWGTLKPDVPRIDVDQMRIVLMDHLQSQAATIEGRTGMPFVMSTVVDQRQWNWSMVAMGFVGKNLECADLFLLEGERDHTSRGEQMRRTGLNIIDSMIRALPNVPLDATGFDLSTGKPWDHIWLAPWLRNATEDMRVLMKSYRRERELGRDHPEWLQWVRKYADWLIQQQREDGSFPRRWKSGSSEIAEPTGTTSYAPVPLLVILSEETGDPKYAKAATRAADYVWENWGKHGLFIGGASDNPNITDKEAGMLSMEAFLSLYDSTKDPKWLKRAQGAADFAETWMWIWSLPMPLDADDANLRWKKGVSTIGLQGISALHAGSADEYLDWAVPSYAKLYRYTKDPHYLDVARILLHATKSMVALPGRLYDLKGPGWQQEGWRLGPGGSGRGTSGHRFWLPWISANHLAGITGLEAFDAELFRELSGEAAQARQTAGEGPRFSSVEVVPSALRLNFTNAAGGLYFKGDPAGSFSIRGDDNEWHRAYATIHGESVVVSSSDVRNPVAARYTTKPGTAGVLFNRDGVAVPPFQTDTTGNY